MGIVERLKGMRSLSVVFWVPNLIGYLRVVLLVVAFGVLEGVSLRWFWGVYVVSMLLDGLDGYTARCLGQSSEFGAFLDVTVDLVSRSILICRAYPSYGVLLPTLELLVFTVNHRLGKDWKKTIAKSAPWLVTATMRNGFYQPLGAASIAGLNLFPMYAYATRIYLAHMKTIITSLMWKSLGLALLIGRLLCATVELWCLYRHLTYLISLDTHTEKNQH